MDAINVIEGPVSVLSRSDVDTDQIIPKQFLKRVERTGFGEFLFYDWIRDGEIELDPNPILVSGRNFGSGSSREHAVWALEQFGFKAVIAPSFSDIFFSNCTKNGFLPVALDEDACEALAAAGQGRIDLESQKVTWEGGEAGFEIDPEVKRRLLGGLDDIALTLQAEDEIEAYEAGPGGSYGPVTTALQMSGRETKPADWDAGTYSRVSIPQRLWSSAVLDRLPLAGEETVLDAGCGSGEVTEALLGKLPRGRVIAVDGSPSMVEEARRRLPDDRVEIVCRDLTALDMDAVADHAFSNAVFHWIHDHDRLFAGLFRAIRPGGLLVAQCGGRGNVAEIVAALDLVTREQPWQGELPGFEAPWNFAGPEETAGRLEAAGFTEVECSLEERVARPKEPQAFLEASGLAPVRARLSPDSFTAFSDRMMEVTGQPETFQYVRLNIKAKRP